VFDVLLLLGFCLVFIDTPFFPRVFTNHIYASFFVVIVLCVCLAADFFFLFCICRYFGDALSTAQSNRDEDAIRADNVVHLLSSQKRLHNERNVRQEGGGVGGGKHKGLYTEATPLLFFFLPFSVL
jgi:hypothetical protein